jgi:2-keto-4-pentenoate hydratase
MSIEPAGSDFAIAARFIALNRLERGRMMALPEEYAPQSVEDGYRIQDELHEVLSKARLGAIVGHKIGCTTKVMQAYLSIDQPCAGGIFERTVHRRDVTLRHGDFVRVGVECELAVRLARPLETVSAPFDRAAVAAAVGEVMAAIEIVDDRYQNWRELNVATLVADDFFNAGIVLGDPVLNRQRLDLARIKGSMAIDGKTVGVGSGADVLGHPLEALAWLANQRAQRGQGLAQGAIVMTGSIVQTHWMEKGQQATITLDGLGEARVRFT